VTIELRNVVKCYTGGELVRAVDGVSLTVRAGECVALYGPSGSGKSTLLELAAGLLAPDRGEVLFDGRVISGLGAGELALHLRHNVGLVHQTIYLMPTSALNNAASKLLADRYALREAREIARPWLERVGLQRRLDHTPQQLSKGECQRVAIARALAPGPRLLLCDEPTGTLDSDRSQEIFLLLRELCREQNIPGLIVTHDQQAVSLVDRVHTLRDGQLHDSLKTHAVEVPAR
jgi:putative ABC transport system ATP-binding protein